MPAAPDSLPYVDEHSSEVAASPAATWDSLLTVAERSFGSDGRIFAAVKARAERL